MKIYKSYLVWSRTMQTDFPIGACQKDHWMLSEFDTWDSAVKFKKPFKNKQILKENWKYSSQNIAQSLHNTSMDESLHMPHKG